MTASKFLETKELKQQQQPQQQNNIEFNNNDFIGFKSDHFDLYHEVASVFYNKNFNNVRNTLDKDISYFKKDNICLSPTSCEQENGNNVMNELSFYFPEHNIDSSEEKPVIIDSNQDITAITKLLSSEFSEKEDSISISESEVSRRSSAGTVSSSLTLQSLALTPATPSSTFDTGSYIDTNHFSDNESEFPTGKVSEISKKTNAINAYQNPLIYNDYKRNYEIIKEISFQQTGIADDNEPEYFLDDKVESTGDKTDMEYQPFQSKKFMVKLKIPTPKLALISNTMQSTTRLLSGVEHSTFIQHFHYTLSKRFAIPKLNTFIPYPTDISNIEASHYKTKAWIKLTKFSLERWNYLKEINSFKNNKVSVEELQTIQNLFMMDHKLEKLRLLAHNQILGAGDDVRSTADMPFQQKGEGIYYIEVKSSVGENDILEKENKRQLNNGIMSNLRHIYNINGTNEMFSSSSHKNRNLDENYVKRPLNSFMIYRASMMKFIHLLNLIDSVSPIIDEVFSSYENKMISSDYGKNKQELAILHRIFDIIEDNDENAATPFIDFINSRLSINKVSHSVLGHVISMLWQTESEEVKQRFAQFSEIEKKIHQKVYPNYKYKPKRNYYQTKVNN
ncbi:hypothetical protein PACTADRAFT_16893 [Pachysolen tannophilus NRRL Y-2460]|uniref:Uncharacterized protein n=1 Tax=Pachysolen tannophilus NRRL Y-2460 TaxID=669874 RepID=A0A1E4TUE7_PACTA|nr:hypothetical protein PACTADRAFT_16893 [Pachysolen tannophilus NRRL Y-2460]